MICNTGEELEDAQIKRERERDKRSPCRNNTCGLHTEVRCKKTLIESVDRY